MVTVIAAVFVLGVLIFIHELGHFMVAKGTGIRVERFSLGLPPKMIGKKLGETEYLLSWIPLGGYVRMAGDNPEEPLTGEPWEFLSRPRWQRMLVIVAGPVMNYLFAFLLVWMILFFGGIATLDPVIDQVLEGSLAERSGLVSQDKIKSLSGRPVTSWDEIFENLLREQGKPVLAEVERDGQIHQLILDLRGISQEEIRDFGITPLMTTLVGDVESGGPAEQAGIQSGDIILTIDDVPVSRWSEMVALIHNKTDTTISVRWRRGAEIHNALIKTKVFKIPDEQGKMKPTAFIGITSRVIYKKIGILRSALESISWTLDVTKQIAFFVKGLVTGEVSARMVGGPIFIAQVAGQSVQQGFASLLSFMALLSVNLALLNLLPIPILDGGHLLILLVEAVKRSSLSTKQRVVIQQLGLVLIVFMVLFVIFNDVTR